MANEDALFMSKAYRLAQQAEQQGEVPVGAIVVHNHEIIGTGFNQCITQPDPCAHAEIMALRQAATHLNNYRLLDCTLYVTLEPCMMCAGAMVHARIKRLVYAASDPKTGAIDSRLNLLTSECTNHTIEVTSGVLQSKCSNLLSDFFKQRRLDKTQQRSCLC